MSKIGLWPNIVIQLQTSENQFILAHIYTVTIASGLTDYFTDFDIDVVVPGGSNMGSWPAPAGTIYKSTSLRFEGMHSTLSLGSEVDIQKIKIGAAPQDTLCGSLFLSSLRQGLLDGATIRRDRVFWPLNTGNVWTDVTSPFPGWPLPGIMNIMQVGKITQIARDHAEIELVSPLRLWDIPMPHFYYQPNCIWRLFQTFTDPATRTTGGCQMVKANFTTSGTVGSGISSSAPTTIPVTGGINFGYYNGVSMASSSIPAPAGPQPAGFSGDGRPTFQGGQIVFTSGNLNGQQFKIETNDDNNLYISYPPLTLLPTAGDSFNMIAGCAKDLPLACGRKFGTGASDPTYQGVSGIPNLSGNIANAREYAFVPSEAYGV